MTAVKPTSELDTHTVLNQPPPFENFNAFLGDRALKTAVTQAGGAGHAAALEKFGARVGSAETLAAGALANRSAPVLETHDRFGRRIDEVEFHPSYHSLMRLGIEAGVASLPWSGASNGHVAHAALVYMLQHVDSGTTCPMTMTYASAPALRAEAVVGAEWLPRLLTAKYDAASRPAGEKTGVTIGMAMTEKQGGSDVRANTTRAEPAGGGEGWFALTGHKWFCSAPMSDAFLTLAYAQEGLTCFLLPRWLPDGARNAGFRLMRLKDKLGDRSNASSEVEYQGALAQRVGPPGRGVATIIQMVQHTRLDCVLGSAGVMRAALAQALWHAAHRSAFQRRLIDQPAMAAVLADLCVEAEAVTALAFRLAQAFDADEPLARLLTPIAKFWVCKRAAGFVYEALECLGGAGYVESGPMPRLFRQAPLNAIWEGSGNVIALDVLRALAREPEGAAALRALLAAARGRVPAYDTWIAALELAPAVEAAARHSVERLAIAAAAAVLIAQDNPMAEAFCALRMQHPAQTYGASAAALDTRAILERGQPEA